MKTVKHEEMRKEYKREDLGKGIRGKYFNEYKKERILCFSVPMWQKRFLMMPRLMKHCVV